MYVLTLLVGISSNVHTCTTCVHWCSWRQRWSD